MNIREVVGLGPVIPALAVGKLEHAVPLAQALVSGGLRALEISCRSTVAIGCIEAIHNAVPGAIVGVGALTRAADFAAAGRAGAQFGVSPGLTPELAAAARGAHQAGGVGMLRALAAPFPDVLFCPAGGITRTSAADYLVLPNVVCVVGSWVAPPDMLEARDWPGIEALAREAAALQSYKANETMSKGNEPTTR